MRLIDADALLDGIYSDNPKDVMLYIANFPTVEPRKGKWIEEKEDWRNQIIWVSCSECGFASGKSYNFCPDCGASMSEGKENEKE